jgi:lysophospholipase L1-like esterase
MFVISSVGMDRGGTTARRLARMLGPVIGSRLAGASVVLLVLAGCTTSHGVTAQRPSSSLGSTVQSVPSTGTSSKTSGPRYYVSIGDSYAAGYQPSGPGSGATTRNGFAYQLVPDALSRGYRLTLVNFACSGATTSSVLHRAGCASRDLGPGAVSYGRSTQAAAAEAFLRAHRDQIALVTVSIGGNDITACGLSASPLTCLSTALTSVTANLASLLTGLRSAGGPNVQIVGITYPDVLLAGDLSSLPAAKTIATLSVDAFRTLINPALKSTYSSAKAEFVDVTAATGAYGPFTATTALPPYGTIPTPVAKICTLTYSCEYHDIHPRTDGYALIAKLIAGLLPSR